MDSEKSILITQRGIRVVRKSDSTFMKVLSVILLIVSFGTQRRFMTDYTTTIGRTIYLPSNWLRYSQNTRSAIIGHELVHVNQMKRYTTVGFALLYLFIPIPILLAYFRMKFEKEAYEETLKSYYEYYGEEFIRRGEIKKQIVSQFTTGAYLWMWPFRKSIETWYDSVVDKIVANLKDK